MLRRNAFILLLLTLHPMLARSQNLDSLMALRDTTVINAQQLDLQLQIAYGLYDTDIREALALANRALREAEEINSMAWIAEAKLAIGRFYDFLGVIE